MAYSTTGSSSKLQTVGAVASEDPVPAVNEGRWWVGVRAVTASHLKPRPLQLGEIGGACTQQGVLAAITQ